MVLAILAIFAAIFVAFVSAEIPTKCPEVNGEDVVLLPNLDDCSTYYECNGGEPVLMECSIGLEYNPDLRVCDYPNLNAVCKHRPGVSPAPSNPDSQHRPSSSERPSSNERPSSSQRPSKPPRPTPPSSSSKPPRPCPTSNPRPCKPRPCRRPKPCSSRPNPPSHHLPTSYSSNWWPLPREYYENVLSNEEYENEEYENEEYDYDLEE